MYGIEQRLVHPATESTVSSTVQVESVSFNSILKKDWISQKPGSLTWERISEPVPVARTSSSGRTPAWTAIGASTAEATAVATVAEPIETRTTAASSQASTSGGMCAPSASPTVACAAPESRRIPLSPPAAARIISTWAMGSKDSRGQLAQQLAAMMPAGLDVPAQA